MANVNVIYIQKFDLIFIVRRLQARHAVAVFSVLPVSFVKTTEHTELIFSKSKQFRAITDNK